MAAKSGWEKKMKNRSGVLLVILFLAGLSVNDAAFAGQGYLSVTPSVNFVRIKGGGLNALPEVREVTPGNFVAAKAISNGVSEWKAAPGVGISAGLISQSNWQLGLGYEFVGRSTYHDNSGVVQGGIGATAQDAVNNLIPVATYKTSAKVDLHNLQLHARYNFKPSDSKLGFFAYGKAGMTLARVSASVSASVDPNVLNGLIPPGLIPPGLIPSGPIPLLAETKTKPMFSYGLGAGASYCFTPTLSGELSAEFFQAAGRKFFDGFDKIGALGFKVAAGLTWKF